MTLADVPNFIAGLERLAVMTPSSKRLEPIQPAEFAEELGVQTDHTLLGELFAQHGSDKSGNRKGYVVYGTIIQASGKIGRLLEVGLGTNNTDVPSHMGREGRPGASLRAFRDFLPAAHIYGADIDERILFSEPRIDTFVLNQTDDTAWRRLAAEIGAPLDLIIDDGLHTPGANITTVAAGLRMLRNSGWLAVEDIPVRSVHIWQSIAPILRSFGDLWLIDDGAAYLLVLRKKNGREECEDA